MRVFPMLALPLILALAACSDDGKKAPSDDTKVEPVDSGKDLEPPEGASLTWLVGDLSAIPPFWLEGVEVCVLDHDEIPCVQTDSIGHFTIRGLPRDTVIDLTFHEDGYMPTLKTIETSNVDMDGTGTEPVLMPPTAPGAIELPPFAVDLETKGIFNFFASAPGADGTPGPASGVNFTLSPSEGDGPVFFDTEGHIIEQGAATSFGGNFYNLEPGDYTLTTTREGSECAGISFPFSGFGVPAGGNQVVGHVLAGYFTFTVGTYCTPK